VFVLDKAASRVLVFEVARAGGVRRLPSLRVGRDPTAIVTADLNGDNVSGDVAVADGVTDRVSIRLARHNGGYGRARWVRVGDDPRALAFLSSPRDETTRRLVVANRGSATVSALQIGPSGRVRHRRVVRVGLRPVALAGWWGTGLGGDYGSSVVVANSGSGTITTVTFGVLTKRHVVATTTRLPGGAASRPLAVSVGLLDRDEATDVAVADAGTRSVVALHGDGKGAFGGATRVLPSGATPAGVLVGNLAGDQVGDVVTIDRTSRAVSAWISPGGDQLVVADTTAENLVARGEHALWSRQAAERAYRLVEWTPEAAAADLPVADSEQPYLAHIGRDSSGALIAAYVRCAGDWAPYIWDCAARQETALTREVQPDCAIQEVALWAENLVYVCTGTGLWVRTGDQAPRRLTANMPENSRVSPLQDLLGEDILWYDENEQSFDLKLTRISGATRTIDRQDEFTVENNATVSVTLSDGEIYELVTYRGEATALFRMVRCEAWFSGAEDLEGIGFPNEVAVDGSRILYRGVYGVWLTDAARVRFRPMDECGVT
jgi:hypothetical protein